MGHPRIGRYSILTLATVLVALVVLPSPGRAGTVRVTLAEAQALAARQNPDLAAARAASSAADERAAAARRAGWPTVGVTAGGSYTDLPSAAFAHKLDSGGFTAGDFALRRLNDPAALFHLGTTLAVEAPVDAFGKVRAGARQAAAGARSAGAEVDEGALDLRLQVATAYQQAALARGALAATERALAGARSREADVEARVEGGAALQAELLRARARRREREADLAERRADVGAAGAALGRALGAGTGVRYEPADAPAAPLPLAGDLAAWTARALACRPLLAAAAARADAARWAVRGGERSGLPDLSLWGQLQDDRLGIGGGKRSSGAGVSLRWNAFDGARASRHAAEAADLTAAEARSRSAADQVRLEVETAWERAAAGRERYAAAAGGTAEGREALRVLRERRQAGVATLTDELETEAASLAAELRELQAAAEAAIADARLERAAGGEKP